MQGRVNIGNIIDKICNGFVNSKDYMSFQTKNNPHNVVATCLQDVLLSLRALLLFSTTNFCYFLKVKTKTILMS